MNSRLARLFGSTPAQRRVRYGVLVGAVIAVPLAVAGLVSGALGDTGENLEQIPAIVVNNDEMVTMTLPDGTDQPVLAGRQLVTELTGPDTAGFDWTISNDEEAADKLASGEAYAVLTIPADFSKSVTSISGESPTRANLDIRTDDAHGYLTGSVAQSVGDAMSTAFGRELTTQYLEGFYGNLAKMGGSLGDAADGAAQLSSGAGSLSTGIGQLADGVGQSAAGASDAAAGASAYADGVAQYTDGVDGIASGLSSYSSGVAQYTQGVDGIAGGLSDLAQQTATLGEFGTGVVGYTAGVTDLSDNYAALEPGLLGLIDQNVKAATGGTANCTADPRPEALKQICKLRDGVVGIGEGAEALSASGAQLAQGGAGMPALQTGIAQLSAGATKLAEGSAGVSGGAAQLASGAQQLSAGSAGLSDGATGLASGIGQLAGGLDQLATGADGAATGATKLATGADSLADGLASGAKEAQKLGDIDAEKTADVVAEPVSVDTSRENEIGSTSEVIGMLFVPIGLWLGAMALFLVFRPFGREALRSTASTGGLVWRALARAGLIALAQAVAVVLLLHAGMGVSWSLLPQTLAFSALLALAFTALHAFFTAWLGRAGLLVSLVLVALQLTSTGGLVPIEVLSGPYQAISPFLPLTWAVQGMQAIVSGAGGGAVAGAAGVIALFGVIGVVGTAIVVGRRRGIRSIGFAAAALG
ncbi:YhgE/Pip domain-containing protein [Agromyces endophyticus]|uniref:YhgE/Pip domain-containing protein n=1 Tax=Agromyces sp. H17E-10 TaxID=2932244 RepID=UPI001FD0048B|nr:YhgE/Pip domain-containing protein [Agromyces sp. H17E-10]UOQ88748.1 YhgE/Pip domain-containing protein [Agromyces sp. H17E-10]